ncbi:Cytochrome C oxidase subunit I [Paraburkholderia kururiensis]
MPPSSTNSRPARGGSAVLNNRRLVLAHFWFAFATFGVALLLGAWQMYVRSPLHAWLSAPELYYRSVTAHGSVMAYVFPTLIAMGFGYAITELSLEQRLVGRRWAWAGWWLVVVGSIVAMVPVSLGRASVLYTFYPPMIGSPFYYIGVVLVVVGSWIWVALMSVNLHVWKKANPGKPVPLPMFANVAGSYLWAWTAVGAAIEILFQILPVALGLTSTIDSGLARVFFSWTLHAIVYFWLMPAYIAYYTLVPRAVGGRLYSDEMARISFILFLVVAMPIGIHHLFADPQVGSGFKFLQSVFTALVAVPTLLTVFTICASVEIAGRLRGGKGVFGWIRALPWHEPMMLAVAFSFVMLGFGGAGGLINMSYQLDSTIHNTQWITGHFHLIFGGAIVIMYFAIAYELWPQLTGRALASVRLMRWQLWLWFIGMMVTTFPWHYAGILGMPRRMAFFDYSNPAIAPEAITVVISFFGALILVASAVLFFIVLARGHQGAPEPARKFEFSVAVHPPRTLPVALNSFGLWIALMIGLTVVNYGYPIAQLMVLKQTSVPAVWMGAQR